MVWHGTPNTAWAKWPPACYNCLHCKWPRLREKSPSSLSRLKRSIFSEKMLVAMHCLRHRCFLSILVFPHGVWSRCRFYGHHNSHTPGWVDVRVHSHFDEGSCKYPRTLYHCVFAKARFWHQIRRQFIAQTNVNDMISFLASLFYCSVWSWCVKIRPIHKLYNILGHPWIKSV